MKIQERLSVLAAPRMVRSTFPTEINGNIMWKLTKFVLY